MPASDAGRRRRAALRSGMQWEFRGVAWRGLGPPPTPRAGSGRMPVRREARSGGSSSTVAIGYRRILGTGPALGASTGRCWWLAGAARVSLEALPYSAHVIHDACDRCPPEAWEVEADVMCSRFRHSSSSAAWDARWRELSSGLEWELQRWHSDWARCLVCRKRHEWATRVAMGTPAAFALTHIDSCAQRPPQISA